MSHNYPNIMVACWEQVSTIVYGFLRATPEVPARQWKGHSGNTVGSIGEKTLTAAIKARDPNAFFSLLIFLFYFVFLFPFIWSVISLF